MTPIARLALLATAAAVVAAVGLPATAHHSFAMYDPDKVVVLKGTVKDFEWSNPHVGLLVLVPQPGNQPAELWTVELTSPGNLRRVGWTRTALKPGDHVAVEINPLRDGGKGGGFRKVTLVDTGQVYGGALRDLEKH